MKTILDALERETAVPLRGVCVRAKVPESGGKTQHVPCFVFVDGYVLSQRYSQESFAYHDATVIRRALRNREPTP